MSLPRFRLENAVTMMLRYAEIVAMRMVRAIDESPLGDLLIYAMCIGVGLGFAVLIVYQHVR